MKALRFSANAALDEASPDVSPSKSGEPLKPGKKELSSWMMTGQVIFSVLFFILLYKLVPLEITTWLTKWFPAIKGQILFNAVDGVIRLAIFVGFLFAISRTKDIKRVFEYHGAEHKVVFNFESGKPVNVRNAQEFVTFHPRCGTSFMFVIMLISMLVYMLVPVETLMAKLAIRIALLPVITGLSYELIRYAAKRRGSFLALLTAPGMWTQRITTKEPSDDQAEVAIRALDGAMKLETPQGGELVIA